MGNNLVMNYISFGVKDGLGRRTIFRNDHFYLQTGAHLAIRGSSGAGKTTFLKLLSGIIVPDEGSLAWGDADLTQMPVKQRESWRGENVGFMFQDFRLFKGLSALENVLLPFTFRHSITAPTKKKALALLKSYQIRPHEESSLLSRGEMQRTALIRVLLGCPKIILADEPTANLDGVNADKAVDDLIQVASTLGSTLIVVSHDPSVLNKFPQVAVIEDGVLESGEFGC